MDRALGRRPEAIVSGPRPGGRGSREIGDAEGRSTGVEAPQARRKAEAETKAGQELSAAEGYVEKLLGDSADKHTLEVPL